MLITKMASITIIIYCHHVRCSSPEFFSVALLQDFSTSLPTLYLTDQPYPTMCHPVLVISDTQIDGVLLTLGTPRCVNACSKITDVSCCMLVNIF